MATAPSPKDIPFKEPKTAPTIAASANHKLRNSNASLRVLGMLQASPNVSITHGEIQKSTGLPLTTISNSVGYLIHKGFPIERPIYGAAIYRTGYRATQSSTNPGRDASRLPKESATIYEQIGTSQGITIVRGEDGELYRLAPLFDDRPNPGEVMR